MNCFFYFSNRTSYLCILLFCYACNAPEEAHHRPSPADMVNLRIGAVSHLLVPTYPTVHLPNSMVRIYPQTSPGVNDQYLASRIYAFPINMPSHRQGPLTTLMVTSNKGAVSPDSLASDYDHDFETSTPYYYSVLLEDPGIWVDYTVTAHGVIYRFRKESGGNVRIVIRSSGAGDFNFDEPGVLTGSDRLRNITQYLYATVVHPSGSAGYFSPLPAGESDRLPEGDRKGVVLDYDISENEAVVLRIGISYISLETARHHAEKELSGRSFGDLKDHARENWDKSLGVIGIEGGTADQQKIFYTAFYRCFERMVNITEEGKYFSVYDGQVHESGNNDFYVDDWSWDTYRTLHPLRTIIMPGEEADMINSYIRIYEQSGWMPAFPTVFGEMGAMIGHHQAAIIADAWYKGIRDYDVHKAYEGLLKNAMEGTRVPWKEGPKTSLDEVYLQKGFFPGKYPDEPETHPAVHSFEGRQSVAVTLEHAYDDWCLARFAEGLGKTEDADKMYLRGQNYRNQYRPDIGFMAPREAGGKWIDPYDPKVPAGIGGREYFAESNAWTYTWFVPHDLAGLIDLMGGKEMALKQLDRLFDEPIGQSKWTYLGYMPDATGLTGLFPMGNEPSFHIPYIYNVLGAPWKTQKRTRQLMDAWFRNDLMGICGDEDGGAMSAWYVFSAMGFYPICPGYPVYMIGSPVFDRVTINLPDGKKFMVKAMNVSARNKYIQSARLNGRQLEAPWFTHAELMNGGEMILEMGPRPDKAWGNTADFARFVETAKQL
ncbi:MAG: GH92 family glycosyl hydrolase [Cyclobacteriaceae bacterium]|nr:GH92 family glycosyl hydrolase [Cyclobacteriaceae bacterium]